MAHQGTDTALTLDRCDPGGLIAQGFEQPDAARGVFFAWVLRLPADVDPAVAAGVVLDAYPAGEGPLVGYLREARACAGMPLPKRRRTH